MNDHIPWELIQTWSHEELLERALKLIRPVFEGAPPSVEDLAEQLNLLGLTAIAMAYEIRRRP